MTTVNQQPPQAASTHNAANASASLPIVEWLPLDEIIQA